MVQFLDDSTHHQAKRLFQNFYPQEFISDTGEAHATAEVTSVTTTDLDLEFADALRTATSTPPSMAELQGYLLDFKNDPRGAVENVDKLRDTVETRAELQSRQEEESRRLSAIAGFRDDSSPGRRAPKGRRLSATDVDRMAFNPQPGWEEACGFKKD